MDWREYYKRKLVTAEQAVKLIKSGDVVAIFTRNEPEVLPQALVNRQEELRGVRILWTGDPEKYDPFLSTSRESFTLVGVNKGESRPYLPSIFFKSTSERLSGFKPDVVMGVVSPPDEQGFCSFGHYMLEKPSYCRQAQRIIMEVNNNLIRTGGDNRIHVSRVDQFVEHDASLWKLPPIGPVRDTDKRITEYVADLIRDGDTIETGIGNTIDAMHSLNVFAGRQDLGCHTGANRVGFVDLVRCGIFNGVRKTLHRGKVVTSAMYLRDEDISFVAGNPVFEYHDLEYINNILTVAAHENFVAINSAVSVDLTGQITAGGGIRGGGGLTAFAIGAVLSKGGRSLIVLPATAQGGKVSRIVPAFEAGTPVTIPNNFADYIVTEYGVASLLGKTLREMASELIAIAHPDFRSELKREVQRLYM
jgi:acyl-CoA hydrolase